MLAFIRASGLQNASESWRHVKELQNSLASRVFNVAKVLQVLVNSEFSVGSSDHIVPLITVRVVLHL